MNADTQARLEEIAALTDKIWAAMQQMRNVSRKETAAVIKPKTEVKTMACQEMEARQEERKPTSPDRKPEAAEEYEVPAENATVMPVGEPKKKSRRDRKLAAEHRRQKTNTSTRENCGPQKRLAVARSGSSRRGKVTRHTKETDRKMPRRATVARRMRDISRPNTTRRAAVAWRKRNTFKENLTERNCSPRKEVTATRKITRSAGHRGKGRNKDVTPRCNKRGTP
jgi:hypothetical protein